MTTAHSLIGGSSADRILTCPGSLALYRKLKPVDTGSDYAAEGSMLHAAIDGQLGFRAGPDFDTLVGTMPGDFGVILTQEHVDEKLRPAVTAWDEYVDTESSGDMILVQEQRVSAPSISPEAFGTADIVARHGNVLVIGDFKFGDGVFVDVKDNAQLLFYAACAMETPELRDMTRGVTHVDLLIIQPARGSDGVWDYERVPVARVRKFVKDYKAALEDSLMPEPPFAIGKGCRFCKVKLSCPLQRGGFDRFTLPEGAVSDADLAAMLERAVHVEQFIEAVRLEAHERLAGGRKVPGYKLVAKRATRDWTDDDLVKARLTQLEFELDEIYEHKLVSPAKAEKLLKQKGLDVAELEGLVTAISSGVTLAPESDKRPAVPTLAGLSQIAKRK